MNQPLVFHPIAHIQTPYKEKFAIPRQPRLADAAEGEIHFCADYADPNSLRGIEGFSHLWLLFHFHQTAEQGWSALVRPPRLGGNSKQGVYATRSTFRPNPIGMSLVSFGGIEQRGNQTILKVGGVDLVDGTPILDIKPYLPWAESLPGAEGGFASEEPELMQVEFSAASQAQLQALNNPPAQLELLITQVLSQDPRPAYQKGKQSERVFGVRLYDYNVRWQVHGQINLVVAIEKVS